MIEVKKNKVIWLQRIWNDKANIFLCFTVEMKWHWKKTLFVKKKNEVIQHKNLNLEVKDEAWIVYTHSLQNNLQKMLFFEEMENISSVWGFPCHAIERRIYIFVNEKLFLCMMKMRGERERRDDENGSERKSNLLKLLVF